MASSDALREALAAAFPDQDWDADRVAAFREACELCASSDYGSDDEDDEPGSSRKPKVDLTMLFGKPKR